MFWYNTVQGSRKFFPAAEGEAVFSDGGCKVFECTSTTQCLHLHLYTIYKEPMYKGKLCATLDFLFSQLIVVEPPFQAQFQWFQASNLCLCLFYISWIEEFCVQIHCSAKKAHTVGGAAWVIVTILVYNRLMKGVMLFNIKSWKILDQDRILKGSLQNLRCLESVWSYSRNHIWWLFRKMASLTPNQGYS
jgi:hypothetical protein